MAWSSVRRNSGSSSGPRGGGAPSGPEAAREAGCAPGSSAGRGRSFPGGPPSRVSVPLGPGGGGAAGGRGRLFPRVPPAPVSGAARPGRAGGRGRLGRPPDRQPDRRPDDESHDHKGDPGPFGQPPEFIAGRERHIHEAIDPEPRNKEGKEGAKQQHARSLTAARELPYLDSSSDVCVSMPHASP